MITLCLASCEDEIQPELNLAAPEVVIDAWLDNRVKEQRIWIGLSQSYFDNAKAIGVSDAIVKVTQPNGQAIEFMHLDSGYYTYTPLNSSESLSLAGNYALSVQVGSEFYNSITTLNQVPSLDRVEFDFEEDDGFYYGVFWARDLEGDGDTFDYLNQIREVTDRPGGFAELFATPLSNVVGNIKSSQGVPALGFFSVSAVSSGQDTLDEAEVN